MKIITLVIFVIIFNNDIYSQMTDNWKWMNPSPQGNSLFALDFPENNSSVGYSAGAYSTSVKRTDSGIQWTKLNPGTNNRLLSIDFINDDLGYVGGFYQLLKRTTDGGQTWNTVQLPVKGPFDDQFSIMDIKFLNANTGYVLGFFQLESKIWKTTNGGQSITQI